MKTKQHPIVPRHEDKEYIQDFKAELGLKNDSEAVAVVVKVAKAARYYTEEDGNVIDRFEVAAKAINDGRKAAQVESRIARLNALIAEGDKASIAMAKAAGCDLSYTVHLPSLYDIEE